MIRRLLPFVLVVCACAEEAPPPTPTTAAPTAAGAGATEVVAEVGPRKMTRADLDLAMFRDAVMAGLPPPAKEPRVKDLLEGPSLEKMIDRELLRQEAERRNLLPNADEVEAQRQLMISSLPQGKTFEGVLQQMGVDEKTFLADLRVDMGIEKLLQAVATETPPPDDAQLKKVFDENPDLFSVKETASASHILVRVAANAPPADVAAAEKKIKAIRDTVVGKSKDTFTQVAIEKSEDPSVKINKGDLGTFERRQMLPELGDAAFKLKEGQVSDVVRTDKGFHVLFGQGVVQGKKRTFDESKAEILEREVARGRIDGVDKLLAKLRASTPVVKKIQPKASPMMPGAAPASQPASPTPGLAPSSQPAAGGPHPAMPLPTKDNVLPGAPNPHAAPAAGGGDLKLKVEPKPGAAPTP